MSNILLELTEKKIAHPPRWLPLNTHFLTMMGSVAYGVSSDTSDCDVYGFCIPAKDEIFPHLRGEISGFGTPKPRFAQYQEHHLKDEAAMAGKGREWDLTVYNIVDYFQLVTKNNPNMIDSLFTPDFCVLHITKIGTMVRENRRLFLHRGCWHTFKGYAYSMLHKTENKMKATEMKTILRFEDEHGIDRSTLYEDVEAALRNRDLSVGKLTHLTDDQLMHYYKLYKAGMEQTKRFEKRKVQETDTKYLYHLVRLLNEVEQIMTEGDLDLLRNREQLKAIRRGDWTEEQIQDYFTKKERELETVYNNSKLPWGPDESATKALLLKCLEEHYGSLQKCVVQLDREVVLVQKIKALIEEAGV